VSLTVQLVGLATVVAAKLASRTLETATTPMVAPPRRSAAPWLGLRSHKAAAAAGRARVYGLFAGPPNLLLVASPRDQYMIYANI
jgi:hypothetical protein